MLFPIWRRGRGLDDRRRLLGLDGRGCDEKGGGNKGKTLHVVKILREVSWPSLRRPEGRKRFARLAAAQRRQACHANAIHPAIIRSPPIGVTIPSILGAPRVIA